MPAWAAGAPPAAEAHVNVQVQTQTQMQVQRHDCRCVCARMDIPSHYGPLPPHMTHDQHLLQLLQRRLIVLQRPKRQQLLNKLGVGVFRGSRAFPVRRERCQPKPRRRADAAAAPTVALMPGPLPHDRTTRPPLTPSRSRVLLVPCTKRSRSPAAFSRSTRPSRCSTLGADADACAQRMCWGKGPAFQVGLQWTFCEHISAAYVPWGLPSHGKALVCCAAAVQRQVPWRGCAINAGNCAWTRRERRHSAAAIADAPPSTRSCRRAPARTARNGGAPARRAGAAQRARRRRVRSARWWTRASAGRPASR